MQKCKEFLYKYWLFITGFMPRNLPTGVEELEKFVQLLSDTYGTSNSTSYKEAIARMILQMPGMPDKDNSVYSIGRRSPYFFYRCIKMGEAKEVSFYVAEESRKAAVEAKKLEMQAREELRQKAQNRAVTESSGVTDAKGQA